MVVLLMLFGILIVGVIAQIYTNEFSKVNLVATYSNMFVGVTILVLLLLWPYEHHSSLAKVQEHYALEETIEKARSGDASDLELAALTVKIAEHNEYLAYKRYWNDTRYGLFIPDEITELPNLK